MTLNAFRRLLLVVCLAPACSLVAAADDTPDEPEARYVLGLSLTNHPSYAGAAERETRLHPVWAVHWRGWRLTGPMGSHLLGFGRGGAGQGASRELLHVGRLRSGITFNLDPGRNSGEARTTQGLPHVPATVRARLYASYRLAKDWDMTASLSPDLLGRQGGWLGTVGVGWRLHHSPTLEWTTGAGVTWGDARYQRNFFGVPPAAALQPGREAYEPGSGWRDLGWGTSFTRPLDAHWFVFGRVSVQRLMGPAADSPLSERRQSHSFGVGLAWRS